MLTIRKKKIKNSKKLYLTAFPKYERLPYGVLKFLTLLNGVDFLEFYDGETFCGFTYNVVTNYTVFIYYLAVDDNLRGKGYGSQILTAIKNLYPTKTVTLNIEPLDEKAENYSQRIKRFAFYTKNGFYDSGYTVYEVGGGFTVLYTKTNVIGGETFTFNPNEFKKVFKKLTFGFVNVKMEKRI
jgi:GNAT superfamily N-acetyltransferase